MSASSTTTLSALLALCLSGCGGATGSPDGAAPTDAAVDGGAGSAVSIPWLDDGAPPIAAPELTPCPAGWREVASADEPTTCDPYPEGGALDCPDGQAHFPGEPGCVDVGSPCPSGSEFSDALPADRRVVYVRPGATGGDGMSAATPYGSIVEFAIGSLPTSSVIALSRGTHAGPVRLARGIALWGACAAETIVSAPGVSDEAVLTMVNAAEARDLTVADSARGGIWALGAAADAVVDGVVVRGTEMAALLALDGGRLTAHTLVVRDTRSRSSDGVFGHGIGAQNGATVDVTRAIVAGSHDHGVFVRETAEVTLADIVVRDTEGQMRDDGFGRAIGANRGATVEVRRALLDGNRDAAVATDHAGTTVTLEDVVVRGTREKGFDGSKGRALSFQNGVHAAVSRVVMEHNRELAVMVDSVGTEATFTDVVIRDTDLETDGTGGRGLGVQCGAVATVTRALLERNHELGIYVGFGAMSVLEDVVVQDTRSVADGKWGFGMSVENGARAQVARALFEGNHDSGVAVHHTASSLGLTDVVIRDTESASFDGTSGRGLVAQFGSTVDVTRALLERNRELGVAVLDPGTTATLSDVVVRDTQERECSKTTCPELAGGHGLGCFIDASTAVTGFVVERSAACGVLLARRGQVDLSDGEIRDNPIGVCLQVEPYDTGRLTHGVVFTDNGTNLQTTTLPLPEPTAVIP